MSDQIELRGFDATIIDSMVLLDRGRGHFVLTREAAEWLLEILSAELRPRPVAPGGDGPSATAGGGDGPSATAGGGGDGRHEVILNGRRVTVLTSGDLPRFAWPAAFSWWGDAHCCVMRHEPRAGASAWPFVLLVWASSDALVSVHTRRFNSRWRFVASSPRRGQVLRFRTIEDAVRRAVALGIWRK